MLFLDYEKIIRDNYPVLIDSYVKQYGEEYREHITKVLEKAKYCIFETPLTISEYVRRKKNEDFMKAILDSYVDLGIDISGIQIDEEGFVFGDKKVGELTKILFPEMGSFDDIYNKGILAFSDEFDDDSLDSLILKERMECLEKLHLKDSQIPVQEYIKTEAYSYNCNMLKKMAAIISERILLRCSCDYDAYIKYAEDLEAKIVEIAKHYEKEYFMTIKEFLCVEDQSLLESGADIKNLRDYYLYFDDSLPAGDYAFSEGVLEFFCDCYTDLLMDKRTCSKEKDEILDKRIEYLKRHGYDVSTLNREELLCDWETLDYLKDYLPDMKLVSECLLRCDLIQEKYEYDIAQACIINDYRLRPLDSEIGTIIDSDGHSCSFDTKEDDFNPDDPTPIICISPLNDTYNLFDISVDHELRHAIETYVKKINGGYVVKMGTDISKLDLNFDCLKEGFTNYNERVTQKLSVEACRERWMKGKFMFSDPYALITTYCISCYDCDLDNLDIIFEPFRERLVEAQISSNFNKIYEVIPKRTLREINSSITSHSRYSIRKLHRIRNELLELDSYRGNKIKKIGSKE